MTVAVCMVVPEGVVLGADSTVSITPGHGEFHYFNNNQKLFEIGEGSALGLLTWGLASFHDLSYRTLIARLADDLQTNPQKSVKEVSERWVKLAYEAYTRIFENEIEEYRVLERLDAFGMTKPNSKNTARTEEQEKRLHDLSTTYVAGFCIAGHCLHDRVTSAFKLEFDLGLRTPPAPVQVPSLEYWGVGSTFIARLLNGFDPRLKKGISENWSDTQELLDITLFQTKLSYPLSVPIRDAIDFVNFCIHTTIKAFKFSNHNQFCGGPIELAVISSDRKFRWVRHKSLDAAIIETEY